MLRWFAIWRASIENSSGDGFDFDGGRILPRAATTPRLGRSRRAARDVRFRGADWRL